MNRAKLENLIARAGDVVVGLNGLDKSRKSAIAVTHLETAILWLRDLREDVLDAEVEADR